MWFTENQRCLDLLLKTSLASHQKMCDGNVTSYNEETTSHNWIVRSPGLGPDVWVSVVLSVCCNQAISECKLRSDSGSDLCLQPSVKSLLDSLSWKVTNLDMISAGNISACGCTGDSCWLTAYEPAPLGVSWPLHHPTVPLAQRHPPPLLSLQLLIHFPPGDGLLLNFFRLLLQKWN